VWRGEHQIFKKKIVRGDRLDDDDGDYDYYDYDGGGDKKKKINA